MKYQAELIKEIVDTRGHDKSSLHYQSECVETWIEGVKGSYPKLNDYQGEWLNYRVENHIGEFPYVTLSDVTDTSLDNVVPYAYKSAILKGKTINNLWTKPVEGVAVQQKTADTTIEPYSEQYTKITFGETQENAAATVGVETTQQLQANKTYYINTFIFDGHDESDGFLLRDFRNGVNLVTLKIKGYPSGQILSFTTQAETNRLTFYYFAYTRKYGAVNYSKPFYMPTRFIISDKLEDVVNQEFFEGMQSVKMPVLTTTGKNVFSPTKMTMNDGSLYGYYKYKDDESVSCTLSISDKDTSVDIRGIYFGMTKLGINADIDTNWLVANGSILNTKLFSIVSEYNFISIYPNNTETLNKLTERFNIQLEHSKVKTTYEPYKSNILSTSEEVVLRGIGDVKDELNLMTGELTENIGEMIINGNETYSIGANPDNYYIYFRFPYHNINKPLIADKLPTVFDGLSKGCLSIYAYDWGNAICYTPVNATNKDDAILELKSYGDIRVQYVKKEKSIKTVDLSVLNQDGDTLSKILPIEGTMHLTTSSDTIQPTFSGEIPVEAITQNLASFIEE